jgi:glycerophosphoryl diester phosphodiesterase
MHAIPRAAAVIAHRGASAYRPEHTLAAYDCALAMGADRLELDVRAARDGTLVVLHDPTLARTAADPRPVRALDREDLAALGPARRPPVLGEVLARYGRRTSYLVELKDPAPGDAGLLLAELGRHDVRGRVMVQSFDRDGLLELHALDPALPLAPLFREAWTPEQLVRELGGVARWATAIAPAAVSVDAALVLAAHRGGLTVQAYTVNEDAEMGRLLALGVDGLITDVPDRARLAVDRGRELTLAAA